MTDEEFSKMKFYDSMILDYVSEREPEKRVSCILISVDFENQIFKLWVIGDNYFESSYITVNHSFVRKPLVSLSALKKEAK